MDAEDFKRLAGELNIRKGVFITCRTAHSVCVGYIPLSRIDDVRVPEQPFPQTRG
jgi:hypothetical protein